MNTLEVDIRLLAHDAAKACAEERDLVKVGRLYRAAEEQYGRELASREFVDAFASLAGEARRNNRHKVVCRILHYVYGFNLCRSEVRGCLLAKGAVGYIPRQPDNTPVRERFAPSY